MAVPDGMSYVVAAALGCRFATAYRAVVAQGAVRAGEWVAVHGCGGVGLSAVMVAVGLMPASQAPTATPPKKA